MQFFLVDVFADKPLAGNPLPVVPDADAIDAETMKRLAREFNHSETTFILKPVSASADWRLRCFMPSGIEAFGAGHNALGAWWWLADSGRLALTGRRSTFRQQLGDRVLPVLVEAEGGRPRRIGMRQSPPVFGGTFDDRTALGEALGLDESDFAFDTLPAQVVSTGAAHLLVAARDRAAVWRARPNAEHLAKVMHRAGAQGCYLFCLDPIDSSSATHARFFHPLMGVAEDPATGSAAGPLAAYLTARGAGGPSRGLMAIEQGHAVGRPSRIDVDVEGAEVTVWGCGVVVAEGRLRL